MYKIILKNQIYVFLKNVQRKQRLDWGVTEDAIHRLAYIYTLFALTLQVIIILLAKESCTYNFNQNMY